MKKTRDEIQKLIIDTVSNASALEADKIGLDQDLIHDLSMDSLSVYEIVVDLEAVFQMRITDEDVERLHTVNDITNYVENRMEV